MEERNYSGVTLKITKNGADLVLPPHAIARFANESIGALN